MADHLPMTQLDALCWFDTIQQGCGTNNIRESFLERFGAGSIAQSLWNEPEFTLGVEYGILMAIVHIFALTPNDIGIGNG